MKLSDFKDERAIEVVADLLEPIGRIAANQDNAQARKGSPLQFAAAMLKNSKKEVMEILAVLSDTKPEDYHCTAASIFKDLLDMLNDPELMQLFGLRSQTKEETASGSAAENTES